jgi:type I restriction-modification system DNA methylase subunit
LTDHRNDIEGIVISVTDAWKCATKHPGFTKQIKDWGFEHLPDEINKAQQEISSKVDGIKSFVGLVKRYTLSFPDGIYRDVPGLCKAATRAEIEAQGWSLNPGRYVGVAKGEELSDEDFKEQLEVLNEELEVLNAEARELEERIAENVVEILETA